MARYPACSNLTRRTPSSMNQSCLLADLLLVDYANLIGWRQNHPTRLGGKKDSDRGGLSPRT
jgi:hypothetical protein